jgi:hypothetical protein
MARAPRLNDPFEVAKEKFLTAARSVLASLKEADIPHAIIGGFAVNAFATPRATKDVDFLVPRAAGALLGGKRLVGEVEGITTKVKGVQIDFLFPLEGEDFLEEALAHPLEAGGVPIIAADALVYLKICPRAARRKDLNDVIEMVKAGKLDVRQVRSYLAEHSDLAEDFDQLVREADLT